jgi:hypothetical protein
MSNMRVKIVIVCTGGRGVRVQGAADSPHSEDGPLQPGGAQAGLEIKKPPKKTQKKTKKPT